MNSKCELTNSIREFLNQILIAEVITSDIRKNALNLRDDIENSNFDFSEVYNCDDKKSFKFGGFKYYINDLKDCYRDAMTENNKSAKKVLFVKQLVSFYGLTFNGAKDLSDFLEKEGCFTFLKQN